MATRIRYGKDGSSVRSILASNGKSYFSRVGIIDGKAGFMIDDADTGETVVHENAPSLSSAKLKAKKALTKLGVTFDNETRVKKLNE